jgi:hypothetical protein
VEPTGEPSAVTGRDSIVHEQTFPLIATAEEAIDEQRGTCQGSEVHQYSRFRLRPDDVRGNHFPAE